MPKRAGKIKRISSTSSRASGDAQSEGTRSEESHRESVPVTEGRVLEALRDGTVTERGLLPYSSNHSFLVVVSHGDLAVPAVYKPQRGESPLWDFEWGTLCKREAAAFAISRALQWNLVPPTVLREATRGLGSVQFYVQHDSDAHYFTVQPDARYALALRQLVLFDAITNNADRKSGHCLISADDRLWAIDHGLCFHTEYKLRTVIWEFADEPIPQPLLSDLIGLRDQLVGMARNRSDALPAPTLPAGAEGASESTLADELCMLLAPGERRALLLRVQRLITEGLFPAPHPQRRNYPWPPV
ncbi:MAG: SCO1664 family protein [Caldilineaceae bacterium]